MSLPSRNRNFSLLLPFLVIALVFGLLIWQKYRAIRNPAPTPQAQQRAGARSVVLFFVAEGVRLARESRDLEPCEGTEACLKATLDELGNGPVGELDEALPDGVTINGVQLSGDTAIVDVSGSFVDEMPSGSSAEMMALYSIVDTICTNFPQIKRVKLTVDGKSDIHLGHLDLSSAVAPDYSLEQIVVPSAVPSTTDAGKGK